MTTFDHKAMTIQLEESIIEDQALIEAGQEERKLINAGIKEARERIATNQRLLSALKGPKTRAKKAEKPVEPEVVQHVPDVIPDEPEVAPFKLD